MSNEGCFDLGGELLGLVHGEGAHGLDLEARGVAARGNGDEVRAQRRRCGLKSAERPSEQDLESQRNMKIE